MHSNKTHPHHTPFGSMVENRSWSAGNGYRFGFNGQEGDAEISGDGNSFTFKYRIQDSRLGRFLSVDPMTHNFPQYSPYHFAGNNPLAAIDRDGLEPYWVTGRVLDRSKPHIKYEYKTEVINGKTKYLSRIHRYNVKFSEPLVENWKPISPRSYHLGRKWSYIDQGTKIDAINIHEEKKSRRGTYERVFAILPGTTTIDFDLAFKTHSIADGFKIEYQDEDGEWHELYNQAPLITVEEQNFHGNITLPEGKALSKIRLSVYQNGLENDEASVWSLKGQLNPKGGSGTYSSNWEDNWSNDMEEDRLAVPRNPTPNDSNTHTTGATNHQNSSDQNVELIQNETQTL